jgi:RNA 2',3'-cyclic 3'-phosphodiesterase
VSSGATVREDERLRLFLALRLPAEVRDRLAAWAEEHAADAGRLVRAEDLHVTLAFLGARPAAELDAIVAALRETAAGTGRIELAPAGWRETRSVGMVRLDDADGAAGRVAAELHDRLEALGAYRREARPWLAHVTVVRFRERPSLRPPLPEVEPFAPSDASVYLSRLHPSGARYEVLASTPLGGTG